MNKTRHSFKQNDESAKADFLISMTDFANKLDYNDKEKLYQLIDHFAENSPVNLLITQRIMKSAFQNDAEKENLQDIIEEKLNNIKNSAEHTQTLTTQQMETIVKNFKQIDEQYKSMTEEDVTLAENVGIVQFDENSQEDIVDTIDVVEVIDLAKDQQEEIDLEVEDKPLCIFCEGVNTTVISATEGYCNICDKRFLIYRRMV